VYLIRIRALLTENRHEDRRKLEVANDSKLKGHGAKFFVRTFSPSRTVHHMLLSLDSKRFAAKHIIMFIRVRSIMAIKCLPAERQAHSHGV
jgi:hypothetical protein